MSAFAACHTITHQWERGYANHPRDPGGATLDGVTQRVYDAYRRRSGKPPRPVRQMEPAEKMEIYRRQYWDAVQGERLPPGIDLVVYDMAVNSGVSRSIKYLQAALGLKQDGHLGEVTLAAVKEAYDRDDDDAVITRFMDARERFLRGLGTFDVFGKGWMNRTRDIRRNALRMEQIEDDARHWARDARMKAPRRDPQPEKPLVYKPEKASAKPAEPVVEAAAAARGGGWLAGLAAMGLAVRETVAGVKETLDGIAPEGSLIIAAVALTAAAAAGLYAWRKWREADIPPTAAAEDAEQVTA